MWLENYTLSNMQKKQKERNKNTVKLWRINICGDYLVTVGAAVSAAADGIAADGDAVAAVVAGAGNTSHRA
jgi:hypothetical protein